MDDHEVSALIDRFNAAWNARDLDEALSMVTDDAVFDATGPAPDGSRHVGRAALRAAWEGIFSNPASHFDTEEILVCGDRFVQRFRYTWGDVYVRGIDLIAIRDGRISEKLSYVKG